MERAVYFDAWFPRQHCYHPSLPPRRLTMVDDLEAYRATSLVWSALGGGSISLPYLEREAWGEIDPRMRFYGFVNDAEFVEHCQRRGIKVFGIVFEVQGWEFPAELDAEGTRVLALNEPRGVGELAWLGLREFTQNAHPQLWEPFEHYFPSGLTNSDGEPVTDLLEECVSRDIHGRPLHAVWVEAPDREHYAFLMDRNNPVWREYLKAIIRIQIDAGVAGVELDESDLPLFSTRWGGCFCKDCMKGFRAYLQALPADELPEDVLGTDLETFHYGSWLLEHGHDFGERREHAPLFWDYVRFQRREVTQHFADLCAYIRAYGASKGREVLVACNSGDCPPHFYAFAPHVDLLAAEQHETRYRQPVWCRYAAGFAGGTPLTVVEQPFAGVIPELVRDLKVGRGYDRLRMMHYEAAALGVNMSLPYGSWLGPVVEDSFWAPHEVLLEIQSFLADHEDLYGTSTLSETAVVFSVPSAFERAEAGGGREFGPFTEACDALVRDHQPFDVVVFPEGELRPDEIELADLTQYRTLVLPSCTSFTAHQVRVVRSFLERGSHVLATGDPGANLSPDVRAQLVDHPRWVSVGDVRAEDLAYGPQVFVDGDPSDLALTFQRVERGVAIHLIRYDYDEERDVVPILPELVLWFRLPRWYRHAQAFTPVGKMGTRLGMGSGRRGMHRLELEDVPLYSVVVLRG